MLGSSVRPPSKSSFLPLNVALRRGGHRELRQAALAFALEGAGEGDVDLAAFGAGGAEVERQVDVAAFDPLQRRFFEHRLRALAALVAAAAAGGEDGAERERGGEDEGDAKSSHGVILRLAAGLNGS